MFHTWFLLLLTAYISAVQSFIIKDVDGLLLTEVYVLFRFLLFLPNVPVQLGSHPESHMTLAHDISLNFRLWGHLLSDGHDSFGVCQSRVPERRTCAFRLLTSKLWQRGTLRSTWALTSTLLMLTLLSAALLSHWVILSPFPCFPLQANRCAQPTFHKTRTRLPHP